MKKILLGLLLLLSSCYEAVQDGVVTSVEADVNYGYQYKVKVKKLKVPDEAYGGPYYWLWTDEVLMVGDTIHIGKVTKMKTNYEDRF